MKENQFLDYPEAVQQFGLVLARFEARCTSASPNGGIPESTLIPLVQAQTQEIDALKKMLADRRETINGLHFKLSQAEAKIEIAAKRKRKK